MWCVWKMWIPFGCVHISLKCGNLFCSLCVTNCTNYLLTHDETVTKRQSFSQKWNREWDKVRCSGPISYFMEIPQDIKRNCIFSNVEIYFWVHQFIHWITQNVYREALTMWAEQRHLFIIFVSVHKRSFWGKSWNVR